MSDYDPNFTPTKHYAIVGQKGVIRNNQAELLLLQRSEKAGRGGRWTLPGGGLDTGENSIASLVREITEERK
jgi:ADP-ribose pyrophosphatase YjhB (NUDIX family)